MMQAPAWRTRLVRPAVLPLTPLIPVPPPPSQTLPTPQLSAAARPPSMNQLIQELKAADQDHEFYPTTNEIIDIWLAHLGVKRNTPRNRWDGPNKYESLLDIGAGNGKVLKAFKAACHRTRPADEGGGSYYTPYELFAIEKSPILCRELPEEVLVIGTDFEEQSLLSKTVDIVFCNPPYSKFEAWAEKIIRQSASKVIYLVIPQRWEQSVLIKDALKFREAKAEIIGQFHFNDAEDRTARAKVHLLFIKLADHEPDKKEIPSAFAAFFNEQFGPLVNKFAEQERQLKGKIKGESNEDDETEAYDKLAGNGGRQRPFANLKPGPNYPEQMVQYFNQEMAVLQKNYSLVNDLDVDLLREFEVSPARIMSCLYNRITTLRTEYWQELFSNLGAITDRLTASSRKDLLAVLQKHVQVDFTVGNILEVVVWVIRNTNQYIDSQLCKTYEIMVDKCNVKLYKSNQRTWQNAEWRYGKREINNTHYALDYRIVTHQVGGCNSGYFYHEKGLDERAGEFLGDLLTLARNLSFTPVEGQRDCLTRWQGAKNWIPGEKVEFWFTNKAGERELLFDVRAFKNRNLHLRLNQDFILALNVEHGRLQGWLRNVQEAVTELKDEKAAQFWNGTLKLGTTNPALLLGAAK